MMLAPRAASIWQRLHRHLQLSPSQRNALSSDDVSSAAPRHQGAPQAARTFAAAATAKTPSIIDGTCNAAGARDDADISLAVESGSTWHRYPHRDQLRNLRPCDADTSLAVDSGSTWHLYPSSRPTSQLEAVRRLHQGHWGGSPAMFRDGRSIILGSR